MQGVVDRMNAAEAAVYVGVSRPTMLRALADGAIPALRLGRRWVVSRRVLDELLAGEAPARQAGSNTPAAGSGRAL